MRNTSNMKALKVYALFGVIFLSVFLSGSFFAHKVPSLGIASVDPSSEVEHAAQAANLEVGSEVMGKRTDHSRTFSTNDPKVFVTEIIPGAPLSQKSAYKRTQYSFVDLLKSKTAHAADSTFYPDANPETTTVDGFAQQDGGGTNWSTDYVNGAGSGADDSGSSAYVGSHLYTSSGEYQLIRPFLLFDTSTIPDDDEITSATLSVYVTATADGDNDANAYINVFSSNPSANTSISSGDFDTQGSTKFSTDKDITGISSSAYADFALNSSGLSNVNKTGISKFMLREGHDIDNVAINGAGDPDSKVTFSTSEVSGTSQDPKLVVVHVANALRAVKDASETVTSSSALQDDDDLVLTLEANKTYIIDGSLFATSTSGVPDIKFAIDVPSDATVSAGLNMQTGLNDISDASVVAHSDFISADNTETTRFPLVPSTVSITHFGGSITMGTTSGTAKIRWSQATSDAAGTAVLRGSYVRAESI